MTARLLRAAAGAFSLAIPAAVTAQLAPVPAANAVAGAYLPLARGTEALWVNPANLALGGPSFSLGLANIGVGGSVLGLGVNEAIDLVRNNELAGNAILDKIPAAGTQLRGQLFAPLATVQLGRIAVGVGAGAVFDYSLGRDLVDLALNGYDDTRLDYQVGNTRGRQATYLDVAAGYGTGIGPIKLGVTGHYIVPRALDKFRMYEPTYDIVNRQIGIEAYTVGVTGGSGFSLDVGGTMDLGPVAVSAAVQNIAGSVTWGENLGYRAIALNNNNVEDAAEIITDALTATATRLDPSASPLGAIQTAAGLYDRAFLPTVLRIGGAVKVPGLGTRVSAQYNNTLKEGFLGNFWKSSIAVGASQKILFFTPSIGFAKQLSGTEGTIGSVISAAQANSDGTLLTAGLGLGPVNIAVAKLVDGQVSGTNREGVILSAGLTIGF
jgi:hypothetical protein